MPHDPHNPSNAPRDPSESKVDPLNLVEATSGATRAPLSQPLMTKTSTASQRGSHQQALGKLRKEDTQRILKHG